MFDIHDRIFSKMPNILGIPYYTIFLTLGIIVGIAYYMIDARRKNTNSESAIIIVTAGIFFGFIGAKVPLLFENHDILVLLTGKSIVGGLLGGMLGVFFIKKALNIKLKLGNVIAPSVALAMSIGRIGCFLNGCCFGIVSSWGFDFGDGNLRLPTQLFEVVFHATAFIILNYYKDRVQTKGILFKIYIIVYFIFRFFLEFIRQNPIVGFGMSIYQIICLLGVFYLGILSFRSVKNGRRL